MAERVPIDEVHPTVLYLDAGVLATAIGTFDFDEPDYVPTPILKRNNEVYLVEGHTRAFVAYLAGVDELLVDTDLDLGPDERRLYLERIEWCRDENVERLRDLAGRVVGTETYVELWVERCLQSARRIAEG